MKHTQTSVPHTNSVFLCLFIHLSHTHMHKHYWDSHHNLRYQHWRRGLFRVTQIDFVVNKDLKLGYLIKLLCAFKQSKLYLLPYSGGQSGHGQTNENKSAANVTELWKTTGSMSDIWKYQWCGVRLICASGGGALSWIVARRCYNVMKLCWKILAPHSHIVQRPYECADESVAVSGPLHRFTVSL